MPPKVSCLTATRGRYSLLCEAIACFCAQTYPNKELIIFNNGGEPLALDTMLCNEAVRVINYDGPLLSLGGCRSKLLAEATGEFIRTWDDDDLYLPDTIAQGVREIGDRAAFKPRRSWVGRSTGYTLEENVMEASITVRTDIARKYGFTEEEGPEAIAMLDAIQKNDGGILVKDVPATYCYRLRPDAYQASTHYDAKHSVAERVKEWADSPANQDFARLRRLTIKGIDLTKYFDGMKRAEDAIAVQEATEVFTMPPPPPVDTPIAKPQGRPPKADAQTWDVSAKSIVAGMNDIVWTSSYGSHGLGLMLPALIAAFRTRVVIEIGIANGFLGRCAGLALERVFAQDALLLSCDMDAACCALSKDAALKDVNIRHGVICADSANVDWKAELAKYGESTATLCIVDGGHDYHPAVDDMLGCDSVIPKGGLMLVHDSGPGLPGVLQAVATLRRKTPYHMLWWPGSNDFIANITSMILQKECTYQDLEAILKHADHGAEQ